MWKLPTSIYSISMAPLIRVTMYYNDWADKLMGDNDMLHDIMSNALIKHYRQFFTARIVV